MEKLKYVLQQENSMNAYKNYMLSYKENISAQKWHGN